MNPRVFLYKLIPGSSGELLDALFDRFDALIIESFGAGGLPDYGDDEFFLAIRRFVRAGKPGKHSCSRGDCEATSLDCA